MPRKTKTTASADKAAQPQFSAELLLSITEGHDVVFGDFGANGLKKSFLIVMNQGCRLGL